MSILKDVFGELFSMFVGDRWLTMAILVLVALCAVLAQTFHGVAVGIVLMIGCLAILVWVVRAEAAKRR